MLLSVLGDSLTEGYPFGKRVSWLHSLAQKLNIEYVNCGICGETTADMQRRLSGILQNDFLTHLLIFGGANDIILERKPINKIVKNIAEMYELALLRAVKVGIILPIIPADVSYEKDFIQLRESMLKSLGNKALLFDFQPAFVAEQKTNNFLDDGVHLTIEGNDVLGEYASKILYAWLVEEE